MRLGRQTGSTPTAVTRSKLSRSEVPSLGRRSATLHAPVRDTVHKSSLAPRFCRSRFQHSASLHPRPPPQRLLALRSFLWWDATFCVDDPARIVIRGLGPRSRISPLTSGNRFSWAVAAYRLLQTDSTYGHAHRAPSPSPAAECEDPSRGPTFSCVCEMFASEEARHPQRAKPILTWAKPKTAGEADHLETLHLRKGDPKSIRADRAEPKDLQVRSMRMQIPLLDPCRAPHCRQSAATKRLETPSPRRRVPILLGDDRHWLHGLAKDSVCALTREGERAQRRPGYLPPFIVLLGTRRSLSAPSQTRSLRHAAAPRWTLGVLPLHQRRHCNRGVPAPLCPPAARLSPDRPSAGGWLGDVWQFGAETRLPRTNRSARTASTIQQPAG